VDPTQRVLPVEDIQFRDPEWEELERAAGSGPSEGRVVYWDPIHGWVMKTGPKIQVGQRGRAGHERPY